MVIAVYAVNDLHRDIKPRAIMQRITQAETITIAFGNIRPPAKPFVSDQRQSGKKAFLLHYSRARCGALCVYHSASERKILPQWPLFSVLDTFETDADRSTTVSIRHATNKSGLADNGRRVDQVQEVVKYANYRRDYNL